MPAKKNPPPVLRVLPGELCFHANGTSPPLGGANPAKIFRRVLSAAVATVPASTFHARIYKNVCARPVPGYVPVSRNGVVSDPTHNRPHGNTCGDAAAPATQQVFSVYYYASQTHSFCCMRTSVPLFVEKCNLALLPLFL